MLATLLISLNTLFSFQQSDTGNYQLLVGSYTKEGNPGIEVFDAQTASGIVKGRYTRSMPNASFMAVSSNTQYLYTVSEQSGNGAVAAFKLNSKGEYDLLNTAAAKRSGPCHVALRAAPIANYVKYVQVGNTVYLSGHGPDKPEGGQVFGKLGKDLTVEQGQEAARLTAISLISTLKGYVGDLNRVKRIVKVVGLVNCTSEFAQQSQVMNGCSNLMV